MTDNATRTMNAAVAGQQVMNDNAPLWNTRMAMVNKKGALDAKVTEIEQLNDDVTDGRGQGVAKRAARDLAARTALKLAKPMSVLARNINDPVLEAETDLVWTELRYGTDQGVIDLWQLVHDRAAAHGAALTADGYIDAAWIPQLQTEIEAFKAQRGRPKAKRSDIKAINRQIVIGIKELQAIKTDLLDLLVVFKESDPVFYGTVKAAFEKDMTGTRHIALRLHYMDAATGIRLAGVEAAVVELGLKKTGSKNGRIDFSQQELPQGNYILISTLKNYGGSRLENVGIKDGKMTLLEVVMQKVG